MIISEGKAVHQNKERSGKRVHFYWQQLVLIKFDTFKQVFSAIIVGFDQILDLLLDNEARGLSRRALDWPTPPCNGLLPQEGMPGLPSSEFQGPQLAQELPGIEYINGNPTWCNWVYIFESFLLLF